MLEEKSDQLERGAATESDAAMIRSSLSEAYERFLLARQSLLAKNGDLLLLLQQDFDFDDFPVYLAVDAPSGLRPTLDPRLLVQQSIKCRPDYLMAVEMAEKLGIVLKYRENQLMPRVDLEGTIGYSGLNGSYGGAFSNTADAQGTEYGIGVVVSMPLGNTEKKALYAETENQQRQALLKLKQEELRAHILISQHINAVETHEKRLRAARHSTRLEMENLEKARESLEKGTISESMVLKVERDISETTFRQHAAAADLQKSLADLWEANGTLLSRHGVGVSGATPLESATVTSRGAPTRSDTIITDMADYGRPEELEKVETKENAMEVAFKNLFTRSGEERKPTDRKSTPPATLVASPGPQGTSPVADPSASTGSTAALIASPLKPKGLRGLFEKTDR
jgi:outer membrane protein TolC